MIFEPSIVPFTDKRDYCLKCGKNEDYLGKERFEGICFECFRETPEYKNNKVIEKPKEFELYSEKQNYFVFLIDSDIANFVYDKLPNLDSKKNKHIIGLDYFLTVYYNNEQNRFNRFATISDHKNQTKFLLYFNSEKITKETMLERLFWDIAEFIESTDFIEDFCSDIKKQINNIPKKNNPPQSPKSSYTPLKCPDKKNQSYNYQFASTYFDKGNFEFDTSSINLREHLRSYKREVYVLLKCRNYYFHNFYLNYYFKNGYLDILKKRIIELKLEFITLRFCKYKLTIKFKRSINKRIDCYGFAINVLDDFIAIGIKELNNILAYYDISKEVFRENIRAENYTQYHLAKDIGCNIETEQPELLERLKLNQMNDNKESLANIGLKHHVHYIDYSRYDDYGYRIAEYEIECKYPNGVSYAELKRDLSVLEPDIIPKKQTTIDKYLKNGLLNDLRDHIREYNKSNVHGIRPFSIESNPVKNRISDFERNIYEIKEFNDLVKFPFTRYYNRIVKKS